MVEIESYKFLHPAVDFIDDSAWVLVWLRDDGKFKQFWLTNEGLKDFSDIKNKGIFLTARTEFDVDKRMSTRFLRLFSMNPISVIEFDRDVRDEFECYVNYNASKNGNECIGIRHKNVIPNLTPYPPYYPLQLTFNRLTEKFDYYIEFPDKTTSKFLALWTIGTYFYPLFYSYPYIYIRGFKRTGKSITLQLLEQTALNAKMGALLTPETAYRIIARNQCTLLIDETDDLAYKKSFMRQLLLNGYKKGIKVPRQKQRSMKIGDFSTEFHEIFCPKTMVNIKGFDDVLADRCIRIIMQRTIRPEYSIRTPDLLHDEQFQILRDMLYYIMFKYWKVVQDKYRTIEKPDEIVNREWELWKPIITLASLCGEDA